MLLITALIILTILITPLEIKFDYDKKYRLLRMWYTDPYGKRKYIELIQFGNYE